MSFDKLPPDLTKLLQELKEEVQGYGGLPSPSENPEFYSKVDAFLKAASELKIDVKLKDLAQFLNVPYGTFKVYLSRSRSGVTSSGASGQVDVIPPKREPNSAEGEKGKEEEPSEAPVAVTPERPVLPPTQREISKRVVSKVTKQAEPIIQENTELTIGLGAYFRSRYEVACYQAGYGSDSDDDKAKKEALFRCLDDMADALFNIKPEYEELKEELEIRESFERFLIQRILELADEKEKLEELKKIFLGISGDEDLLSQALLIFTKGGEENE